MNVIFRRRFSFIVAGLCLLAALVPISVSADTPIANNALWEGGPGAAPSNAIPMSGIMLNQLDPGKSIWYTATFSGPPPYGVTVNYNPGDTPPPGSIQLRVDWTNTSGILAADWPGYYQVAEGSSNGLAPGVLYWSTSDASARYYFRVVNNSTVPIGYAIALTGSANPPPGLNPPPPIESLPPLEA
jgi:hypothetical protein